MPEKREPHALTKPVRRLPRFIERELAKFLNTVGFSSYGVPLWDLATQTPASDPEPRDHLDPAVYDSIVAQAVHDPSVLAPGASALRGLRHHRRTLKNAWNADSASLFDAVGETPQMMLIVAKADAALPGLVADVRRRFPLPDVGSLLVIVTEDTRREAEEEERYPVGDQTVLFWRDHCQGVSSSSPRVFALFVHAVAAPIVIFTANDLCLSTMGRYGRALVPYQSFFCLIDDHYADTSCAARDAYAARTVAPFAILLTGSEEQTNVCATSVIEKDRCVPRGEDHVPPTSLDAKLPPAGRPLIDNILKKALLQPIRDFRPSSAAPFDVTVTIVFHREQALALSALASLAHMVQVAKDAGLRVEARAMLDKADEATRAVVRGRGTFLDDIVEVDCGDLGLTRNAATPIARGRYLTFLDGDDLWGADWLTAALRAAVDQDPAAIWHPSHIYSFYAADCKFAAASEAQRPALQSTIFLHRGSDEPDFDGRELLLESVWSANAFAPTDVFRAFPYRPNNWTEQAGLEDWRWNLETLGSGLSHLVVPETVHLVREKENGSLEQLSNSRGLLPILSEPCVLR